MEPASETNDFEAYFVEEEQVQNDVQPPELQYVATASAVEAVIAANEAYVSTGPATEEVKFDESVEQLSGTLEEMVAPAASLVRGEDSSYLDHLSTSEVAAPALVAANENEGPLNEDAPVPPAEGSVEGLGTASLFEESLQQDFSHSHHGATNDLELVKEAHFLPPAEPSVEGHAKEFNYSDCEATNVSERAAEEARSSPLAGTSVEGQAPSSSFEATLQQEFDLSAHEATNDSDRAAEEAPPLFPAQDYVEGQAASSLLETNQQQELNLSDSGAITTAEPSVQSLTNGAADATQLVLESDFQHITVGTQKDGEDDVEKSALDTSAQNRVDSGPSALIISEEDYPSQVEEHEAEDDVSTKKLSPPKPGEAIVPLPSDEVAQLELETRASDAEGTSTLPVATDTPSTSEPATGTGATAAEPSASACHGGGLSLIGKQVMRKFGSMDFVGEVEAFDEQSKVYKVQYEDGDGEELEWPDLELLLAKAAEEPKVVRKKPVHADGGDRKEKTSSKQADGKKAAKQSAPGEGALLIDTERRPQRKIFKRVFIDEDPVMQTLPRKRRKASGQSDKDKPLLRLTKAAFKRHLLKKQTDESEGEEAEGDSSRSAAGRKGQQDENRTKQVGKRKVDRQKTVASDDDTKPDAGPGAAVVGQRARKKFGSKFYTGIIKYFFPKEGLYKVVYADGDREDLWWHELKPILVPEAAKQVEIQAKAVAESRPKNKGRLPKGGGLARKTAIDKLKKVFAREGQGRQKVTKLVNMAKAVLNRQKVGAGTVADKRILDKAEMERKRGRNPRTEKQELEKISTPSKFHASPVPRNATCPVNACATRSRKVEEADSPGPTPQGKTRVGKRRVEPELKVGSKKRGRLQQASKVEEVAVEPEEISEEAEYQLPLYHPSTHIAAARFASPSSSDRLEFYGWGEVESHASSAPQELTALKMLPTQSPVSHLAASQHQLAVITAAGQVMVWRNQHGHIQARTRQWEHVRDLEGHTVVLLDIAGPSVDRRASGYAPEQEDQVPDPFYLAAVTAAGEDFVFVGSPPQEEVRTLRLDEEPHFPGLKGAVAQSSGEEAAADVGVVVQVSVGIVEAVDESPFIGYITNKNQVYIRAATKDGAQEEVHHVTGFTGAPIKIQCGGAYCAIILTDDGKAWIWGFASAFPTGLRGPRDQVDPPPYSTCMLARGSLHGRKVLSVGCHGQDFVALTDDGEVHQWTQGTVHPALGVFNAPSPPLPEYMPMVPPSDPLLSVSIGAAVCAGVTKQGKVHTWSNGMKGASGSAGDETPLGRPRGTDTHVGALGNKVAIGAVAVPGSVIVVTSDRPRGPGTKKKG